MKLFYSPNSPYARKARLAARFAGVGERVEEINVSPLKSPDNVLLSYGPGRKVPSLLTDAGTFLVESPIICRHLDAQGNGSLYPASNESALEIEGLTHALIDALYWRNHEKRRPESERSPSFIEEEAERARRCYDWLEKLGGRLDGPVTIAQIGAGAALGYADFRHPDDAWRNGRPALAAWFEAFSQRPEMRETFPPGD